MAETKQPDPGTRAVWSGESKISFENATQTPVVHSVSYGYPDLESWLDAARGRGSGFIYGRNDNPTVRVFEEKIAALEGAPAALGFGTGMGAISATLFTLLRPGDTVVSVKDTYGGTSVLFMEFLPRIKVRVRLCETTDLQAVAQAIAQGCKVVYLETPTNPTLKVLDLARISALAKKAGAVVVVDNTFATPINQNPLELGADLVIHSATKFLGGHADALGGAVCGSADLIERIYHYREIIGSILHPEAAYLILRGMKTLHLRVARQNRSALALAHWLEDRDQVEEVFYPGLPDDPGHRLAAGQMRGFGGVLSFTLRGGLPAVGRFLKKLRYAHLAANLGAVETIAGPPATTSHVECTPEERAALGIPEGLVRYSVGIEDVEDLRTDLAQALGAVDENGEEDAPNPGEDRPSVPRSPFDRLYAILSEEGQG